MFSKNISQLITVIVCPVTVAYKYDCPTTLGGKDTSKICSEIFITTDLYDGDTRSVMVIEVGNGHGDTSSSPGRGWLHFTLL